MAPKRKYGATASSSTPKAPAKRRSKLAKENDITADEEAEIQEAFSLFAIQNDGSSSKEGEIQSADVRRCLIALNAPPDNTEELHELLDVADPDGSGWVSYEHFLPVAALKMNQVRDRDGDDDGRANEEVDKAYRLFTKGEERDITIADLRRITKELREDVPENILKDMIREATGGGLGGVGRADFEDVMRRAGVFG